MKPVIKDPWRTAAVQAKATPPSNLRHHEDDGESHVTGTASSDDPLDWDLRPDYKYLLRAPRQDYALLISDARSPVEASNVLLRTTHNVTVAKVLKDAGFQIGPVTQAKPSGFTIGNEEMVMWLPHALDVADGFRRLVQTLLRACREERGFRERLEQLGVTPVMP